MRDRRVFAERNAQVLDGDLRRCDPTSGHEPRPRIVSRGPSHSRADPGARASVPDFQEQSSGNTVPPRGTVADLACGQCPVSWFVWYYQNQNEARKSPVKIDVSGACYPWIYPIPQSTATDGGGQS